MSDSKENKKRPLVVDWNAINTMDESALNLELKRLRVKDLAKLREFRHFYSTALFIVTVAWITIVLLILLFNKKYWFNISDKVMIVLLSTTTVNVLAFFALMLKYIFATPDNSKKFESKEFIK